MKLLPTDSHKSFYGKAEVIPEGDSVLLKSYNTIVCALNLSTMEFSRLWSGYSATTMRHVNSFRETFNLPAIHKADWLKL